LLDAETNLIWAVKYLRGAWMVSDGDLDRAVMWYARGYYYEARDRCLLVETGWINSSEKGWCREMAWLFRVFTPSEIST
ncbi:MAG: hypothetical protein AAFV07_09430, partial [Bacteroidota bacterium]